MERVIGNRLSYSVLQVYWIILQSMVYSLQFLMSSEVLCLICTIFSVTPKLEAEWFSQEVFRSKIWTGRTQKIFILPARERERAVSPGPHCKVTGDNQKSIQRTLNLKPRREKKARKRSVNRLFCFSAFKPFQDLPTDLPWVFLNIWINFQITKI